MDVHDYLIDQSGNDWAELLSGWSDSLPTSFTVWLVNRFGDVFALFDDGSIHMLDVGVGAVEPVANNRDHFAELIDVADNANNWLMIPLVDRMVEAGKILEEGRCYSFIIPPIMGGEYSVANTSTLKITEHYGVYASIHQQIKDLPDGTQVRLRARW